MTDVFNLILLALAAGAAIVALIGVVALLLPRAVERSHAALEASLGRSVLLGLVNALFFLALAAGLARGGEVIGGPVGGGLAILAVLILAGLAALAVVGLTGLAALLAGRMAGPAAGSLPPLGMVLRAALLLLLACLAPFVGWWLLAPLAALAGLGAGIWALVRREAGRPAAAVPLVPQEER